MERVPPSATLILEQIPKSNSASRSAFHWHGTFVYDGVVYDHIKYRLRQANDRYSNYTKLKGKRSMRFRFNRGHLLQARGSKWKQTSVQGTHNKHWQNVG